MTTMPTTDKPEVQEAIKKIMEYLKREKPYLFALDEKVKAVHNGIVYVGIRIYNGKVTDLLEVKQEQRITFKFSSQQ